MGKISPNSYREYVHAWMQESSLLKNLHEEFSKKVQELCVVEVDLLKHEKNLMDLAEQYDQRVVNKPFFEKAQFGFTFFRNMIKPKNSQAKILKQYLKVLLLLGENERKQASFIASERVRLMWLVHEEFVVELKTKTNSLRKKRDQKLVDRLGVLQNMQDNISTSLMHYHNDFDEAILHLNKADPGLLRLRRMAIWNSINAKRKMLQEFIPLVESLSKMEAKLDIKHVMEMV